MIVAWEKKYTEEEYRAINRFPMKIAGLNIFCLLQDTQKYKWGINGIFSSNYTWELSSQTYFFENSVKNDFYSVSQYKQLQKVILPYISIP